jgi:hypothetical protein
MAQVDLDASAALPMTMMRLLLSFAPFRWRAVESRGRMPATAPNAAEAETRTETDRHGEIEARMRDLRDRTDEVESAPEETDALLGGRGRSTRAEVGVGCGSGDDCW